MGIIIRERKEQNPCMKRGISYVYFIYGLYNCFNIVSSIKGEPEAVLIRAVEPLDNLDYISNLRYKKLQ